MTLTDKLICLVLGLLGMVIHVFGVKIPSFKARVKVSNEIFTYSEYLQDDLAALITSAGILVTILLILPDLLAWHPVALLWVKVGFIFIGFTDSSIIVAKMGKADDKLNKIIDEKTGLADPDNQLQNT